MTYLVLKAALSGIAIMLVSEAARYKPAVGGLIASLPLISVLAAIWLWRDTGDAQRIALLLESTFWFVLPSLPMFLAVPVMLRQGFNFWLCLVLGCLLKWSFMHSLCGYCRSSGSISETKTDTTLCLTPYTFLSIAISMDRRRGDTPAHAG